MIDAMNPDDPSGPPIKVRLPDEIVNISCPDCGRYIGGGDPRYARLSAGLNRKCVFCGKGPAVIDGPAVSTDHIVSYRPPSEPPEIT